MDSQPQTSSTARVYRRWFRGTFVSVGAVEVFFRCAVDAAGTVQSYVAICIT